MTFLFYSHISSLWLLDVVLLPRGYDRDMIAKYWKGMHTHRIILSSFIYFSSTFTNNTPNLLLFFIVFFLTTCTLNQDDHSQFYTV